MISWVKRVYRAVRDVGENTAAIKEDYEEVVAGDDITLWKNKETGELHFRCADPYFYETVTTKTASKIVEVFNEYLAGKEK